jgi:hypothetical protein
VEFSFLTLINESQHHGHWQHTLPLAMNFNLNTLKLRGKQAAKDKEEILDLTCFAQGDESAFLVPISNTARELIYEKRRKRLFGDIDVADLILYKVCQEFHV